jgi:hypothetical protein
MESNGFGEIYALSYWGVVDSENGFGIIYRGLVYNEIYFDFTLSNLNFFIPDLLADLTINWEPTLGYDVGKNIIGAIVLISNNQSYYSNQFDILRDEISDLTSITKPLVFDNVPSELGDYRFELELTTPENNPFINPNPTVKDIWIFNEVQWQ